MTNGDKIRNMTDEELAYIIMCPYDTIGDTMPCITMKPSDVTHSHCMSCMKEWLQKEAPEEKPEPAWKKAFMRTFLGRNGGM